MIKKSGIVERLEPCPFCGATDLTLTVDRHGWKVVECNDCGMKGPCIDLEGSEYLTRWNTRPAATLIAELQAERDRLHSELDASNKNHRSMAQQMAELQDKLERAETDLMHVTESFRCADVERDEMRDRALAAESSLHRVRGERAWQPIETAPKDNKDYPIQVCGGGFSRTSVAFWTGEILDATHWAPMLNADTNADAPGNVGLVSGVSSDQTSLNKTGLDSVKTGAVG